MNKNEAQSVVDSLGGVSAVSRLCEITPQAVSQWVVTDKIPQARKQFLKLLRPDVFKGLK